MNRRTFLKSSGLALVASGLCPDVFVRMAQAGTTRGKKVMVAIFQRGAVDGLNVVVPHGEQAYYAARPTIALPRPGSADGAAIDLDGFFGLHPSLSSIAPHFRNRTAAFVHAVGSPDASRSHFDAQDFMESGTPGVKSTQDGFLSRALAATKAASRHGRQRRLPRAQPPASPGSSFAAKPPESSPLRAVSMSASLPRILSGSDALAMTDVATFGIRGASPEVASALQSMYGDSFQAAKILRAAAPEQLQPANGAQYPRGPLGDSLRQIAQLIRSDVGLEIAFADVGGWDTHAGEGGAQGQLANNLRTFSEAIAAFAQDLGSKMGEVVLVTMSEFGRTVRENGNRGTDHGHANFMMVMGGGVKGGKVYGQWPGLSDLYEGRDLAVTTDFRDVFGEILTKQLGLASLKSVFPGYEIKPRNLFG